MKKFIKYITVVLVLTSIISCEDMLEPVDENKPDIDYLRKTPSAAEGLLINGYKGLINQFSFSEVATDDAVHNQLSNSYKRIAKGELNAQYMPGISRWNKYEQILYINKFLEVIQGGEVVWKRDEQMNQLFQDRLHGEALALRGLYHFYILQAHAGYVGSDLLGIPYMDKFIEATDNFNIARLGFKETVNKIMADFDAALDLLPMDYNIDASGIEAKYSEFDVDKYLEVNGPDYDLRISGRIVKALKARLALFAASPSFLNGDGYYEIAANLAGELLSEIGGVAGLSADGAEFYTLTTPVAVNNSNEILWRQSVGGASSSYESNCFPPSVNGKGYINPTHNLVMAFPMANGYPATEANGWDPQDPYANRDPRLKKYIVVDGESIGGGVINTGDNGVFDGVNKITERSTTTGYYLRKLLHPDVRIPSSGTPQGQNRYNVYFRYTELFLIFAEAANEVGGADNNVINGLTPRSVIAALRQRAGIDQPDNYLASIATKEDMRNLIRNERRLELCFEGYRFWDLRRWGADLNETAKGYYNNGTEYVEIQSVEVRDYPAWATYMPIPDKEDLKYSNLLQNEGW